MSIKARVTPSLLAVTLLTPFCFYATQAASEVNYTVQSNGYQMDCEMTVLNTLLGQWTQFQLKFTLPAESAESLVFRCYFELDTYGFKCYSWSEDKAWSVYIWYKNKAYKIDSLAPGSNKLDACSKGYSLAEMQVCKTDKTPPNCMD